MWYKIKVSYNETNENGKDKNVIKYYLTDATNFADAGYKVVQEIGTDVEVEDVSLLKNYKPSVNEYFEDAIVFIVKVAQDMQIDDTIKTVKYPMPVFAKSNDQLQQIMKDYIKQGLDDMRLTTISETKWIYIK